MVSDLIVEIMIVVMCLGMGIAFVTGLGFGHIKGLQDSRRYRSG